MIKWLMQKYCDAQADAKLKAEAKIDLENKRKKNRESPICPSCKKQHDLKDLKGTATIKNFIDFGHPSRIIFIECPECKKVFCVVAYVDKDRNMVVDGFAIYDKEEEK